MIFDKVKKEVREGATWGGNSKEEWPRRKDSKCKCSQEGVGHTVLKNCEPASVDQWRV